MLYRMLRNCPALCVAAALLASPAAGAQDQVQVPARNGTGQSQNPASGIDPEVVVPEGTVIPIIILSFLNSKNSQPGDVFYAESIYPIYVQQRAVIPRGSTLRGRVTQVVRPGKIKGKGRLGVQIDDILLPNGVRRDIVAAFRGIHSGGDETLDRKSETVQGGGSEGVDAGTVVGLGTQGAIIGAIAEEGAGAAIGAGAGAAAALGIVLFTRGRDLVLEPGTQFDLELKQPLRFAYGEIDFSPGQMNSAGRGYTPSPRYERNQNRRSFPFPGIGIPWPMRP